MIGLLFFGAIALWALIALVLGVKLPEWLRIQRYRLPWTVVCVVLVFFAPVADEVIAWPQMQALCKQVTFFELAPGMDEQRAYGRRVNYAETTKRDTLWPPSVEIVRREIAYVDAATKEPVLQAQRIEPIRGMLGVPNGSSGGQMTVFLGERDCGSRAEDYDSEGIPIRFSHLKLTKAPTP